MLKSPATRALLQTACCRSRLQVGVTNGKDCVCVHLAEHHLLIAMASAVGLHVACNVECALEQDPSMLTLEERIARLEKQTNVVELRADSALSDIPDEVRHTAATTLPRISVSGTMCSGAHHAFFHARTPLCNAA